jgi:hypothetical protein
MFIAALLYTALRSTALGLPAYSLEALCSPALLWLAAAVDFSLLSEEADVLWQQHHRETKEEIKARGLAFMAQVMARPERNIAVGLWGFMNWGCFRCLYPWGQVEAGSGQGGSISRVFGQGL